MVNCPMKACGCVAFPTIIFLVVIKSLDYISFACFSSLFCGLLQGLFVIRQSRLLRNFVTEPLSRG